ncbi:helix-turn-helix domain-containing protein [Clostridium folliculivorans]|uniref:HTH araC/xylS-type domain-containing protein n=1 Tax=Clostridium folliculivorans TaxID=2886038 RepID=A0A9W6DC54_9CLOT|nr:response regulator transcription factor [Clostridium folliculivorans]GKU26641.1 hypothetical protein CFOLD11_34680 [Clostridium folliculivorans]GKU28927.1 hypothetical protein CFB3_10330 [Clostridium folliculivorans]
MKSDICYDEKLYTMFGINKAKDESSVEIKITSFENNEKGLSEYISTDKVDIESFNKERTIKQFKLVKELYREDIESAGVTLNEITKMLVKSALPDHINKMLIYGLIDIFLMFGEYMNAKRDGFKSGDILSTDDIHKILACSDVNEVQAYFLEIYERIRILDNSIKNKSKMKVVYNYILKHFKDPQISLSSISEKFNLSNTYISHMFKKEFGYNVLDLIHRRRIEEAKELLENTGLTVLEISERVGYYNHGTLAKIFKRIEGIKPSEFRELKRNL